MRSTTLLSLALLVMPGNAYAEVIEISDDGEARIFGAPASPTNPRARVMASSQRELSGDPFEISGRRHGIDPNLLRAVAWTESRGNNNVVSPKGARGIMQLMPATAAQLGVDPSDPKLAGQSARYLYDQLLAFKAQGHRRASGVMGAIAVNLTDADMHDTAAYFAGQRPRQTAALNPPISQQLLAEGQSIYREGISHNHAAVPACASCHALSGMGLPPEFPRLAGQHEQYLLKQLDEFRSDRRNSNPNQMMSQVAHKLSDRDIQAVAGYIARMK